MNSYKFYISLDHPSKTYVFFNFTSNCARKQGLWCPCLAKLWTLPEPVLAERFQVFCANESITIKDCLAALYSRRNFLDGSCQLSDRARAKMRAKHALFALGWRSADFPLLS
jgi:hypothetical protein